MGEPSTMPGWLSLGIVAGVFFAAYLYIPEVASGLANVLAELFGGVIAPVVVALAGM
ncbi:hypothetical protein K2Q08_00100 [Patescibacteria group bacterium]|nr:hypothetical protein [Patescibacteria group bacterium]